MKLKFNQGDITIDNNSEEAQKILRGYDFEFKDNKLVIKPNKIHYDIADFEEKVKLDKHTKKDVDEFLKQLIKIYKKINYNMY